MTTTDSPPPSAPAPRILIVEDEEKTRTSLAEGLRLQGWEVVTAATDDKGDACAEKLPFDLVILDWMLPGRNGLAVLANLRGRWPS